MKLIDKINEEIKELSKVATIPKEQIYKLELSGITYCTYPDYCAYQNDFKHFTICNYKK